MLEPGELCIIDNRSSSFPVQHRLFRVIFAPSACVSATRRSNNLRGRSQPCGDANQLAEDKTQWLSPQPHQPSAIKLKIIDMQQGSSVCRFLHISRILDHEWNDGYSSTRDTYSHCPGCLCRIHVSRPIMHSFANTASHRWAWSIWLYRLCRKKNTLCQSDRFAWTYSGRPSTVFHPSSRKTVEVCVQLTFQNGSHKKHGTDMQRLCCNIIRNLNLVHSIRTYTEHYHYAHTK